MLRENPPFSEVLWFSKSLSWSSISPSSLSETVSAYLFCTSFSSPFNTSLRISLNWMYLLSTPLRQCLFFGVIVSPIFVALCFPFVLKYNWVQICFRCIVFPILVVTVCSDPLTAVCNFYEICLLVILWDPFRRIWKDTH